ALVEDRGHLLGAERRSSLSEGSEGLDHPLGEQLLLVEAADLSPAAQVPVMLPVVEEELVEGADVAAPRMARIGPSWTLDVGDHAQHLLSDDLGVVGHADDVATVFDIRCLPSVPLMSGVSVSRARGSGNTGA